MRNAATIGLALLLAACGGSPEPEDRSNAVEYVNVQDETIPAEGEEVPTGNGSVDTTLPVAGTADQRALADANSAVPRDKRRQLSALLECEEMRLGTDVTDADRPAFVRKTLETLNADPNAVANCRAQSQTTTPTQ